MVVDWEQETGHLMTSGDVRVIRIWDTEREMKVQDIPTGADSCVTSLSCDPQRSLVAAGLGDGSVRVYDRRVGPNECGSMNLFIAVYNSNGDVISNIKYYDGFMGQRIGAISCLAFHPYWPHLVVGSNDYYMSIYSAEKRLR